MKKGELFVLGTTLVSGLSIFVNKFAVTGTNPVVFSWLKNTFVGFFLLFLAFPKLKKLNSKQWKKLVLIGLLGGSIPFILFFKGLSLTSASSASLIHKSMFLWIALISIFLGKKISKYFVIPAAFLLGGLFLINPYKPGIGDLMILGATLLWSAETLLSKHTLKDIDAGSVAFGRMFFGSFVMLAYLLASGTQAAFTLQTFQWVGITSVFLLGYVLTWYSGLKFAEPTKAASILLLGSPITTILGIVLLKETVSLTVISGIFLIAIGVFSQFTEVLNSKPQVN